MKMPDSQAIWTGLHSVANDMPACRMSMLRGVTSEKLKAVKLEINAFHYIEGAKTRI